VERITHLPSQSDQYFFDNFAKALNVFSFYEKIIVTGDLNAQEGEDPLDNFSLQNDLTNIVKKPTCYKNKDNPSVIDLLLTNTPKSFKKTQTFFTGLSDCHKLVLSVFKTTFTKSKPKEIFYRDYKNFESCLFNADLQHTLLTENSGAGDYKIFEQKFVHTLELHAPLKRKLLRANHAPYVTKVLRKAIMKRSSLETKYFKNRTQESLENYKRQKNYCSRLYKKERKKYFNGLKTSVVSDNKEFWKNILPLFSEKRKTTNKITLVENDTVSSEDKAVAEKLSDYFDDVVRTLQISNNSYIVNEEKNITDPVEKAIQEYDLHPSIIFMRSEIQNITLFEFCKISIEEMKNEINRLNPKKSSTHLNIPTKVLKLSLDTSAEYLTKIFNDSLTSCIFPDELKLADITPIP